MELAWNILTGVVLTLGAVLVLGMIYGFKKWS